ncbi:GNAT family N-acetyltransferase [Sedimentitalea sp. HM32M-2]|uniref:GNAT family N-acetyltransferase n=1 Tax=Sedimentitalea sp. HM32M-2 TaxID=3351566 RepID=UPI00363CFB65
MTARPQVRETTPQDIAEILKLYPQAFPDEDLRPVVAALLAERRGVLSLAGFDGDDLMAHVLFSRCATGDGNMAGALLGPLAVAPVHQRQGIGSALVRAGFGHLEKAGVRQVFVLGDPSYYARFGFSREARVTAPYPMPEEWAGAWQSVVLAGCAPLEEGSLRLPTPWMEPALWSP